MVKSDTTDTKIKNKCIEFIKNMFHIYLEDRNFPMLISMLDENITWFGIDSYELCKNREDTVRLLENESKSRYGKFEITEQWYDVISMNHEFCTIIGELKFVEVDPNPLMVESHTRFSMVCHITNDRIKLFHSHFSIPATAQNKVNELGNIANNMVGGIQLCKYEENFPILYVNNGFLDLTGYTREEVFAMKYHTSMIPDDEVPALVKKINEQVNNNNKFSVEYRLTRKDGKIIWVLDRGNIIEDKNSSSKLQSVIVDITEQKETEIMLKVSEKRYQIALTFADITMYEYNVVTKDLILLEKDSKMYDVSTTIKDGPNTFVKTGIIEADYATGFLEMYQKIDNGEPTASCYIKSRNVDNIIHDYELNLTNIYDDNGRPVRAIGVRKNITQLRQLQRENQYGKTLTSNQMFIYEANVTDDKIITMDKKWMKQFGLDGVAQYCEMKEIMCKKAIHPNFVQTLLDTFSKENITNAYKKGDRLIHIEYQRKVDNKEYQWFRKNANIIKDEFSGDITIRCYIVDINDAKIKEIKQQEDQRLYETVLAKSSIINEINLTQDIFISGHENWWKSLDIAPTNSYTKIMDAFLKKFVHPEDCSNCIKCFQKHNIIDSFFMGNTLITCDFRYHNTDETFTWLRCSFYLYEDNDTGDIKGYSYLEDINAEKTRELELIYKSEHDSLTGLYNKATTEKNITDFFGIVANTNKIHALFIIDIDYFKSINDNFGHAHGDIVLTQVAHKIKDSFRDIDIVGRIGGDEFIVLMKNIPDKNTAIMKAHELCNGIESNYAKNNISLKITISIGITFYGEHGDCYQELFKHSDTALYVSKEKGRNTYTVYDTTMK